MHVCHVTTSRDPRDAQACPADLLSAVCVPLQLYEKSFLYGGDDGGVVNATLEQWQRIITTFVAHGQQTKRQKLLSDPLECLIIRDSRPEVQQVGQLTSGGAGRCGPTLAGRACL